MTHSSESIELPTEYAKSLQQNPVNLEIKKCLKYNDNDIIKLSQVRNNLSLPIIVDY